MARNCGLLRRPANALNALGASAKPPLELTTRGFFVLGLFRTAEPFTADHHFTFAASSSVRVRDDLTEVPRHPDLASTSTAHGRAQFGKARIKAMRA